MKKILLVMVLAIGMMACSSGPKLYKFSNEITTKKEYNFIINQTTEYLRNSGYIISSIDKEYGLINAEGDVAGIQIAGDGGWAHSLATYLLSDCGRLQDLQLFADKVKINVSIQQSANGNKVKVVAVFDRTRGGNPYCVSTGELEKQILTYIETGEIVPFPEYKTENQIKKEAIKKKIDEDRKRNYGK